MEDNKSVVAQSRGNVDIKEDKYGFHHINYNGELIMMTLEKRNQILNEVRRLSKEIKAEKEQNLELKAQVEKLKIENSKLIAEIPTLRKMADDYKSKYEKFAQNQGRGTKTVLTDEYKAMLKEMFEAQRQMSLMDMYKAMVLHGYKGTYESVRKYVAESKKANKWL